MTKEEKLQKRKETSERHSNMICQVAEIKLQSNHMSKLQKEQLNQLFKEAKWFKNYCITCDIYDADPKVTSVDVLKGKGLVTEELTLLSSSMKQDLIEQYKTSIKSMSTNKKNGNSDKNGKFKFKSVCNEIPLRQLNNTYYIDFTRNFIEITKLKGRFKVNGLRQIPEGAEIANAQFLRKPSGYYLHIIYFVKYKNSKSKKPIGHGQIGIDFGIEHNLITSDGEIIDVKIPETKSVKLASKKLNKAFSKNYKLKCKELGKNKLNKEEREELKHLSNHLKRKSKLQAAYEKQTNKKVDFANKIESNLLRKNDLIVIQDELISKWQKGLFGKEVQVSCMGTIKKELKQSPKVLVIESSFPSTQLCPICGEKTKHDLDKRNYKCEHCGYEHPNRDIKAAETLLNEGLNRLFGMKSDLKESLVEPIPNTSLETEKSRRSKKSATKQEATNL